MAQGLHSAAFTPVQRSRKVQDSFTIGKQMSKPLLSSLFKNAHAHTHTYTHHAHARWGCHYTGIRNKPGNPGVQLPIQSSMLFFLILKKLHQIKTTCQNNNNKNHTVIPRVVKKDKRFGDVIVETQLFLFPNRHSRILLGSKTCFIFLKIKSHYFLTKYQAWVFPHVCKILTLLPTEISRETRAGERRDSMLSNEKYCRLNGIYFYLAI